MERWQKIRNVRVTIGCNSDWERSASAARSGPSTVSQYSAESERVRLLDMKDLFSRWGFISDMVVVNGGIVTHCT